MISQARPKQRGEIGIFRPISDDTSRPSNSSMTQIVTQTFSFQTGRLLQRQPTAHRR